MTTKFVPVASNRQRFSNLNAAGKEIGKIKMISKLNIVGVE